MRLAVGLVEQPGLEYRTAVLTRSDLSLPGMVAADADAASAGMGASETIAAKTFDRAHMRQPPL